jgi:hypothetical protein
MAWRCSTYCFGGTDATPRIVVSVDTTPTDGEEGWRRPQGHLVTLKALNKIITTTTTIDSNPLIKIRSQFNKRHIIINTNRIT